MSSDALYALRKNTHTRQGDVPKTAHWAILVFESRTIHFEGDERSRTHPGHGYPAYNETLNTTEYYPFYHKDEWERALERLYLENPSRTDIKGIHVSEVVTPKLSVKLESAS